MTNSQDTNKHHQQEPVTALESVLCDPSGKCCIEGSDADRAIVDGALAALKAAKQEPVAYIQPYDLEFLKTYSGQCQAVLYRKPAKTRIAIYTSPLASKPLTDEQIAKIASTPCAVVGSYVHTFARAIEAAHGIKGDA